LWSNFSFKTSIDDYRFTRFLHTALISGQFFAARSSGNLGVGPWIVVRVLVIQARFLRSLDLHVEAIDLLKGDSIVGLVVQKMGLVHDFALR